MHFYRNFGKDVCIWNRLCIIFTVFNTFHTPIAAALKCYICGDSNSVLLKENPATSNMNPGSCDTLTHLRNATRSGSITEDSVLAKQLEAFIMKCPEDNQGCITQIQDDKILVRSCDTMPIDDCQTANGITYCYCSNDLCNIDDEIKTNTMALARSQTTFKSLVAEKAGPFNSPYFDDEDYFEMSGDKSTDDEMIREFDFDRTNHHRATSDSVVAEGEQEKEYDDDGHTSELDRLAKEHNDRLSTLLKILSTISPTSSGLPKHHTHTAVLKATSFAPNGTVATTSEGRESIQATSGGDDKTQLVIDLTPTSAVDTHSFSSSGKNRTSPPTTGWKNNQAKSDDATATVTSTSTRRTTEISLPTATILNRNLDSDQNKANLIQFYNHLLLIPFILASYYF